MRKSLLLLSLTSAAVAAAQQAPTRPATLPVKYRPAAAYSPVGFELPASTAPAMATGLASVPTVRAAALLPAPARMLPLTSSDPAPHHYLAGVVPAPAYDLYQNLPEEFRKRTLPAPYTEPLPLQLLRGALGR